MFDFLRDKIHDPHFVAMVLAAIAVSMTAYTLVMPMFAGESLSKRM
jgi:tight adherence protein C